jgi:hypothetical protein
MKDYFITQIQPASDKLNRLLGKKIRVIWEDDIWYYSPEDEAWYPCNHENAQYKSVDDVYDGGDDGDGYITQEIHEEWYDCPTCGAFSKILDDEAVEWRIS